MVFCPKWAQITCTSVGVLLFAGVLIIGILLPTIVDNAIHDSVKSGTPLTQSAMGTTMWNKFINQSTDVEYYVFNITNLNDVLANGARPNVVSSAPVRMIKREMRYNITNPSGAINFTKCTSYEIADAAAWATMNQVVTVPNLVYLGGVANVGRTLALASLMAARQANNVPSSTPFLADNLNGLLGPRAQLFNDLFLNVYVQSQKSLWTGLNATFAYDTPTNTLTTGFRFLGIGVYLNAAATILTSVYSIPLNQVFAHIAAGGMDSIGTVYNHAPYNATMSTFTILEFPTPLAALVDNDQASFAQQVGAIFNTSNPYSVTSVTGLTVNWPSFLSAYLKNSSSPESLTQAAAICTNLFLSKCFTDLPHLASWVGNFISDSDGNYLRTLTSVIASNIAGSGPKPGYAWYNSTAYPDATFLPKSWSDLVLLQYGTGMIASMFIDQSLHTTLANAGVANSVFAPGLLNSAQNSLNPILPEIAATCAKGKFNPPMLLPIQYTQTILKFLSGDSSISGGIPQSTVLMPIVFNLIVSQLQAHTVPAGLPGRSLILATVVGQVIDQACGLIGCPTALSNLWKSLLSPIFSTVPNFPECSYYYLSQINSAVSLTNPQLQSGLFISLTVGEVLFGQRNLQAVGQKFPGVLSDWSMISGPIVGALGVTNTYDQIIGLCNAQEATRQYSYNDGTNDINSLGQLRQYEGIKTYTTRCDYEDPQTADACAGVDSTGLPKKYADNWNMYGVTQTLVGSYDGQYFPPLKEGSIVPSYLIFVDEVRRAVPVTYTGDVTVKGIGLRRYRLQHDVLYGATATNSGQGANPYRNALDWYIDPSFPDGMVNYAGVSGGVPISISQPHLVGVNDTVKNLVTGLDTDPAHVESYLTNVDIEPLTGRAFNVQKRLQANVYLNPANFGFYPAYSTFFKSLGSSTIHIPVYWGEVIGNVTDSDASSFKSNIYDNRTLASNLKITLVVIGSVFVALFLVLLVLAVKNNTNTNTTTQ